jgi:hypothetical protein
MAKKKNNKRRDRYLTAVSNLLFFTKDCERRDDVLLKLDWALRNLGKEDRVLWVLGIVRKYHLVTWNPTGAGQQLPEKDKRKRNLILRDFGLSRIVEDYERLVDSFIPNWPHFMSLTEIHDSQALRKLPFNIIHKGKQVPLPVDDLLLSLRAEEEALAENASNRYCEDGVDFLPFKDDWKWVRVAEGCSRQEAVAMGHCGNGVGKKGDVLYSLREPIRKKAKVFWRPHLTFICNKNDYFGEMKGRANSKPSSVYNERITKLLKQSDFRGIKGGGYLPENNFDISELSSRQIAEIIVENPRFDMSEFRCEKAEVLHRFDDDWDLAFHPGFIEPDRPKKSYKISDSIPMLAFRRLIKLKSGTVRIPHLILPFVQGYLGLPLMKRSGEDIPDISTKLKKLLELVTVRGVSAGSLLRPDCPWFVLLGSTSPEEIVSAFPRFASATPIPQLVSRFGPGAHLVHAISLKLGVEIVQGNEDTWKLLRFRSVHRFLECVMDYPTLRTIKRLKRGDLPVDERRILKQKLLTRLKEFEFGQSEFNMVMENPENLGSGCSVVASDLGIARICTEIDFDETRNPETFLQHLVRTYDYNRMPVKFAA